MNENFLKYFSANFFESSWDLDKFIKSINKSLTKTIRINTNKIAVNELVKVLKEKKYNLKNTFQSNVFYIERDEDFDWLEKRLGFTIEHLNWYFYIQELWASSSVFFLSNWNIDNSEYLILDVASSPGGKTTQLSEYYPNSFIVANEFDRNRTAQLLSNIERMWCDNIGVTNYNWQFIGRLTEVFDKILLDAPCSWEGIGFKSDEHLKYWNLKNIKKISDLQKKLLLSSFNALKVGWEILYSTCTMNKIENEEVVEFLYKENPWCVDVLFEKRFWPHIDETWWFYVCKIKKLKSINYNFKSKEELYNKKIEKLTKTDERIIDDFCKKFWINFKNYFLYKYWIEVIILKKNYWYKDIEKKLFFFKLGKKIGKIEGNKFIPNHYIWRDFWELNIQKYYISSEQELDFYLRGFEIWNDLIWDYIQLFYEKNPIGLSYINSDGKIKNNFPGWWLRK